MEILLLIPVQITLLPNLKIDIKKINKDLELSEPNNKNNNYKKNFLISINPLNLYKNLPKLIISPNPDKRVLNNSNNHVKDKNNLLNQSKNIKKKSKNSDSNNRKEKKSNSKKKDKKSNKSNSNRSKNVKSKFFQISKKYKQVWKNDKFNIKDRLKKSNNWLAKSNFFTKCKINSNKKKQ